MKKLRIERFKCYMAQELELRSLVALTGVNGAGKTSVLQALLLARMASSQEGPVPLNGQFGLSLGESRDVLTSNADPEEGICVGILDHDGTWKNWRFGVGNSDERRGYLEVLERPTAPPLAFDGVQNAFTYLSAERLGPRDVLSTSSEVLSRIGVGHQGEYTAHVLALNGRLAVSENRCLLSSDVSNQLLKQTERWLAKIVREIEIDTLWYSGTNVASLRFKSPGFGAEWTRPANMGFGISYALPVIVAGLLVPSRGVLVVENPEAHLHPAGQSAIGAFLANVAADGVQVFVETHSDHVINGMRLAIAQKQTPPANDAIFYFFTSESNEEVRIDALEVKPSGNLSKWPPGFFDQLELDLAALSAISRRR